MGVTLVPKIIVVKTIRVVGIEVGGGAVDSP
jgi:hypothetical protein